MWWLIIIGIVIYVIYRLAKNKNATSQSFAEMEGGMLRKYEYLVNRLTQASLAKVVNVTKTKIHIRAVGQATATSYYINEKRDLLEIQWVADLGVLGVHRKTWTFPHNFPQTTMIKEIEDYMQFRAKQMLGG